MVVEQLALMIVHVEARRQSDLPQVGKATRAHGRRPGSRQCRQKKAREHGNDSDHDEQLDQSKCPEAGPSHSVMWRAHGVVTVIKSRLPDHRFVEFSGYRGSRRQNHVATLLAEMWANKTSRPRKARNAARKTPSRQLKANGAKGRVPTNNPGLIGF
jgi:hypothetical protein